MMAFVDESSELAKGAPRTLAGLQQLERDLLHYFKVGAGADVEEFWRRASAENLELVRKRDVVVDTLRRGRVLNMDEYAALEDAFEEIQMCGKIDGEQADRLNEMLDAFSRHPDNLQYFEDEEA